MTKAFVFSLCLLLVFNGCLAARQSRTSQQNECQLNQLQAREPDNRIQAEAGEIETWDYNRDDFQCAGVAASRIRIEPNGLHLPAYSNAPQLIYIVQGRGVLGTLLSGCPETFEDSMDQSQQQQYQQGGRGQRQQQEEQEERQREQQRRRQEQEQQGRQGHRGQQEQEEQEERQREQQRRRQEQEQQGRQGHRGQQEQEEQRRRQRQQGQQGHQQEQLDRHQKVRRVREGDVIAIPAGVAYWSYNDGDQSLLAVSVLDVSNNNNQLDQNPRRFYLAGNPEDEFNQQGQSQQRQQRQRGQRQQEEQEERERQRQQEREEQQEGRQGREREEHGSRGQREQQRRQQQQQGNGNNVFSGFTTRLLAQALNVDEETARNLKGENDNRNQIVRVRGQLDFLQPPRGRQQREHEERQEEQLQQERQHARQQGGGQELMMANGIEENFCNARLTENLGNPQRADIYTPQAGRISRLNSNNLPILRILRLSAERGFFYNNAIYTPHWNLNAHSVVYVLRGNARVQVVNENGERLLDDQVQEGQLFIVPQNHAVIKQAGNRGFEYIAFKTKDNAVVNTMAGRTSILRALPEEVVANAYQISREQARMLKYNRQETAALSSQQGQSSYRAIA